MQMIHDLPGLPADVEEQFIPREVLVPRNILCRMQERCHGAVMRFGEFRDGRDVDFRNDENVYRGFGMDVSERLHLGVLKHRVGRQDSFGNFAKNTLHTIYRITRNA